MQCPVCQNTQLVMSERQGIEIDYCPQCRGVWLDRGELDKLIDRAASPAPDVRSAPPAAAPYAPQQQPQQLQRHPDDRRRDEYNGGYYRKKKKEGLLSQIFDFD